MTEYYFYVGYKSKDGKFHAWGPYDRFNNLKPVLYKTGGFISDLYRDFYKMDIKDMDDKLKEKFVYNSNDELVTSLYYLPSNELPDTNFIKERYFLTDDLADYLLMTNPDVISNYDYESYSVEQYNLYCTQAIRSNNKEEIDRLSKYQYWSCPDYTCKEFESFILSHAVSYNGFSDKYTFECELKEHPEESPLDYICILLRIS